MRRTIYLISSFLLFGASAFAQGPETKEMQKEEPTLRQQVAEPHVRTFHRSPNQSGIDGNRAACDGDTIFYEDFGATPAGSGDSIVGNNSHNIDWDTSGTGPAWKHCDNQCTDGGAFPIGPLESSTASNGYAVAEMYATFVGATSPPEVHMEMDSAIDLTGYEQPMVSFQTLFRYCCALGHNVYLEVSTDTGWYRFNPARYYSVNNGTPNPSKFTYSLEEAIQNNKDSVKLRFTWPPSEFQGSYSTAYSWFIDDIVIREGHRNDVGLSLAAPVVSKNSTWFNDANVPKYADNTISGTSIPGIYPGKYSMIPRCAMDSLRMGAELFNEGRNSLNNAQLRTVIQDTTSGTVAFMDSTQVAVDSQSAYGGELPGYDPPSADTLWTPSNFKTDVKKVYSIIQRGEVADTADCYTDNNTGVPEQAFDRVEVTERTYGIDDENLFGGYFSSLAAISIDPSGGTYPKMTVYNAFEFSWFDPSVDTVKQVCFHVNADCTEAGATVTAGISNMTGSVYGQSDLYTIKSSDLGNMVCLDVKFTPSGNQIKGHEVPANTDSITTAFVEYQGSSNNFGISTSGRQRFWEYKSWYYWTGEPNPYTTSFTPAIRVKMNEKDTDCKPVNEGPNAVEDEDGPSSFLVEQNRPNPFSGSSTVAYELSEPAEKVSFSVRDVTGKLIHSEELGRKGQGRHRLKLNSSNFEAGIYYYSLEVDGVKETRKMMVTD